MGGSYGVNVAGFARYKEWMARGLERVRDLGPVLGPLHPVVAENVALLKRVSGLDEVSFHMSGTEAVMAAVRLARFNTRPHSSSCASPAPITAGGTACSRGSAASAPSTTASPSRTCTRRRSTSSAGARGEIAAVLVNPVQSFHPERAAAQRRGAAHERRAEDRGVVGAATPRGCASCAPSATRAASR